MGASIVFHFDLLQDVAVLTPLVRLAPAAMADILFLVTAKFHARDGDKRWIAEVAQLASTVEAEVVTYTSPFEAAQLLSRRRGLCICASESDVDAHIAGHNLLRSLPAGLVGVTLQHGFECVGFLHNRRHAEAHGEVRFAADIVVGWFDKAVLRDVAPTERAKLYVAGPTMMIAGRTKAGGELPRPKPYVGVICENSHSVRFGSQLLRSSFIADLDVLARRAEQVGIDLFLRPHPAGRFLRDTADRRPASLKVSDEPMYLLDARRFAYAISAPSTVLFDFVLADVPVAIWQQADMDGSNFAGLPVVASADDCWAFIGASTPHRAAVLEEQRRFLGGLRIPPDVAGRYRSLLALANR